MNGRPPGSGEAGDDQPGKDDANSTPAPGQSSETVEAAQQDGAPSSPVGENGASQKPEVAESVTKQLQELSLGGSEAEGPSADADDGEESLTEEDDGEGEWISSFALHGWLLQTSAANLTRTSPE